MIDSFRGNYDWASNFYLKAPFRDINNITYGTSEHYFACCKTLDPNWCQRIIDAPTAAKAKKLGQQCPVRPDWNNVRIWVMWQALLYKFGQNADILQKLINTGSEHMEEGNYWHDNFWGNCKCGNRLGRYAKCLEPGHNVLGRLLMNLRAAYTETLNIANL